MLWVLCSLPRRPVIKGSLGGLRRCRQKTNSNRAMAATATPPMTAPITMTVERFKCDDDVLEAVGELEVVVDDDWELIAEAAAEVVSGITTV
jgi:hypothetical protein